MAIKLIQCPSHLATRGPASGRWLHIGTWKCPYEGSVLVIEAVTGSGWNGESWQIQNTSLMLKQTNGPERCGCRMRTTDVTSKNGGKVIRLGDNGGTYPVSYGIWLWCSYEYAAVTWHAWGDGDFDPAPEDDWTDEPSGESMPIDVLAWSA